MHHDGLWNLYLVKPGVPEGRHPAGRFLVRDGKATHLEDYHGLLGQLLPEDEYGLRQARRVESLRRHPYLRAVPHEEEAERVDPATVPEADLPPPDPGRPRGPAVFDYYREGMDKPHLLEVKGTGVTLDGADLSPEEVTTVVGNLDRGAATLRRRRTSLGELRMSEKDSLDLVAEALAKADYRPEEAMGKVAEAVRSGALHPDVESSLRRLIFEDRMVPGVGNKYAFSEFAGKGKPGVYVSLDANDFKAINDKHGHGVGDEAIVGVGGAVRDAADEVGREHVKVFRNGGDEFVAHLPTEQHAVKFAKSLHQRLGALPPVGGTHKLSVSMGFGPDLGKADQALLAAKRQKVDVGGLRLHPVGAVPNLAHSAMPGSEGPVSLGD